MFVNIIIAAIVIGLVIRIVKGFKGSGSNEVNNTGYQSDSNNQYFNDHYTGHNISGSSNSENYSSESSSSENSSEQSYEAAEANDSTSYDSGDSYDSGGSDSSDSSSSD